ncbi:MAG TPA: hypothetical protein VFB20_16885 [Burkholderiales bacterium]|nr:hypothetical protein [Burkholderiales bacterium]
MRSLTRESASFLIFRPLPEACHGFVTTEHCNSEPVIGVAASAFPGHPLVYLAIIQGSIVELPMLLPIAMVTLESKDRIGAAPFVGHDRA